MATNKLINIAFDRSLSRKEQFNIINTNRVANQIDTWGVRKSQTSPEGLSGLWRVQLEVTPKNETKVVLILICYIDRKSGTSWDLMVEKGLFLSPDHAKRTVNELFDLIIRLENALKNKVKSNAKT